MNKISIVSGFLLLSVTALTACGGSGSGADSAAVRKVAAPEAKVGKATIQGVVRAPASAAKARRVQMNADPTCASAYKEPPVDHLVRVNDGMLEGAVVFVKEGPIGSGHATRSDTVVLDQVGCLYTPRVVGLQVGQALEVRNSDATLHNVNATATKAGRFNAAMPMKGQKITKRFNAPEVFVRMKCDVHPWMEAHVAVFDHPFFAVTGADGKFSIGGLPAGSYTIGIAHPSVGQLEQTLKISEDAAAEVDVTLGAEG